MEIKVDDLSNPLVIELIGEHLDEMAVHSPPESIHALKLDELKQPEITFWTVWSDSDLLGCGALKLLEGTHGEIKSMRTAPGQRRKGVARAMLEHIIAEAKHRGLTRLSLETGSQEGFLPARKLYESFGFEYCPPFGSYTNDPNSQFMTKKL